jgi:hypothetical protein
MSAHYDVVALGRSGRVARSHRTGSRQAFDRLVVPGMADPGRGSCGVEQTLQLAPASSTGLPPQSAHSQVSHAEQWGWFSVLRGLEGRAAAGRGGCALANLNTRTLW